MKEQDYPALYRDADSLSLKSQKHFFKFLKIHICALVASAILSIFNSNYWWLAIAQCVAFLFTLSCSIYLFKERPDRDWYAGRALAESIKTLTWRYICRAEPFQDNEMAQAEFRNKLKQIYKQNKSICQKFIEHLGESQTTDKMNEIRELPLQERIDFYKQYRIQEQLLWYQKKSKLNTEKASLFFWLLIAANFIALILSIFKIKYGDLVLPIDVMIAIAGGLLSWIQAKRFTELSASYALTAREIGFINEQFATIDSEDNFSKFIGDAENAFSREHTQWAARRDV